MPCLAVRTVSQPLHDAVMLALQDTPFSFSSLCHRRTLSLTNRQPQSRHNDRSAYLLGRERKFSSAQFARIDTVLQIRRGRQAPLPSRSSLPKRDLQRRDRGRCRQMPKSSGRPKKHHQKDMDVPLGTFSLYEEALHGGSKLTTSQTSQVVHQNCETEEVSAYSPTPPNSFLHLFVLAARDQTSVSERVRTEKQGASIEKKWFLAHDRLHTIEPKQVKTPARIIICQSLPNKYLRRRSGSQNGCPDKPISCILASPPTPIANNSQSKQCGTRSKVPNAQHYLHSLPPTLCSICQWVCQDFPRALDVWTVIVLLSFEDCKSRWRQFRDHSDQPACGAYVRRI
ncbi:hypothetical protein QBC32DRAFT_154972 [Pseudoneurospora amorphoporcata]|uniref:Uncharacterized protein n=1 Tax=Pseudoneurospora amorphoporcata TaxID=241081 RepID=A0AAN6NVG9_9PEZI|nr:hypothetical protein QBC32DRAFT_154972 [Pseudoneurospora amorphoporcata]